MKTEPVALAEIPTFTDRADIVKVLPEGSIGIELGVAEGYFSSTLLATGRFSYLYSVDMWAGDRGHNVNQYKKALRALLPYKEQNTCLRMRFDEAVELFEDEFFDFIYIDGYAHTGQENGKTLEAWWRKLKKGGIFAGDDYDKKKWPLVQQEVDSFIARRELDLRVLRPAATVNKWSRYPSWVTQKPIDAAPDRIKKLRGRAEAAEIRKDWRTAFASYDELFLTEGRDKLDIDTLSKRRRNGVKWSEQLLTSGDVIGAKEILKPIVAELTEYFPSKGIASSLAVPIAFDTFGVSMISHKVGSGWLPEYSTKSDKINEFFRVLEVGDVAISAADAAVLTLACAPLLSNATFGFWMLAHSILFRSGLIEAAYIAKSEAAKRVIVANKGPTSKLAAESFLSGTFVPPQKHDDQSFANLVNGRSIALVGPAVSDASSGHEIDKFDLIIRPNPISLDALAAMGSQVGSRTDVAYFNIGMLTSRRDEAYSALRATEGLKFACFRSPADAKEVAGIIGQDKVRECGIPPAIFMGRGYALRHYIADLLLFEPKQIKVFNADFFLSTKTHYDNYLDRKLNLPLSYVVHDVRESWLFMKQLTMDGHMEADSVLSEILSLDERDFYSRISLRLMTISSKELRSQRKF